MKNSIFSWYGFVQPLKERLESIRRAGFDGVSLWWEDETYPKIIKKEKMPQMVRSEGLYFENIHTPYQDVNDLWSEEKTVRNKTIARYMGYLDQCSQFKIPVMVMHVTDVDGPKELLSQGLDSFMQLREYGTKLGVRIAVENTRDADLVDGLLTQLQSDHFGLCYDSSHDWLAGQTKGMLLENWSHRLFTTHLSDNDMEKDRHWIPGDGEVDWDKLKILLKKTDLEYASMELVGSIKSMEDPDEFLKKAYEQMRKLVTGQ
ncbi:sugar phosphate isomerase/epimerase [Alkalibacter rhizosphaerae]|uniref:Sugar phosphate isomerase/epimerase n=1 Tax=Alkalibacter rhizosphaerae TaxID=2815577 RepID=A0A974XEN7_9FIRM|nr:sugar phosphate isomerase/epimerase family protein [Alkalibacter rhizosphaerae]QSX08366.1 sugar phosphate isomerase/epimerase [Alkalibacter rhizosphaerae]